MQTIKRVALSSPESSYPDGKSRYVVSQMFTQFGGHSGEVKLYDYNRETSSSRLVAHATDLPGLRTIAWSGHPAYECLLACGTTQGKVHIVDLNSNSLQSYHPSNVNSNESTRRSSASSTNMIGTLSLSQNRPCMAVAWSVVDPSVVIAAYDKTKQQHSLCVWDLEMSLQNFAETPVKSRSRMPTSEKLVSHSLRAEKEEELRRAERLAQSSSTQDNISEGVRRRPLQQYLPSECVNSVATFHHTNTLVLAGTSSKAIKCIDLRASGQSGQADATPASGDSSLAFSLPTRSIFNLCTSGLYPHLFASCEDGLTGVVKVWDTRFLRSNTGHPGLVNPNNHNLAGEICSYEATGRGGIAALRWDQQESSRGGQRLGIGTKEGGVLMFDVLSGETSEGRDEAQFGRSSLSSGQQWTTMIGVKNTQPVSDPTLQTFAFLPSREPGRSSVLSIFRDNKSSVEDIGVSPVIASGRMGDASVAINSHLSRIVPTEQIPSIPVATATPFPGTASPSGAPLPRGRTRSHRGSHRSNMNVRNLSLNRNALLDSPVDPTFAEQNRSKTAGYQGPLTWQRTPDGPSRSADARIDVRERSLSPGRSRAGVRFEGVVGDDWDDILGMDIGEAMKRKALMDFGLELSSNDSIEAKIPTTNGFLFEWLDRFLRLMGLAEMRSIDGYDFTLHGVYGIWTGQPKSTSQSAGLDLAEGLEGASDSFLYSKAVMSRSSASKGSRTPDNALSADYIRAMESIIRQRPDDFLDTVLPVETSRRTHRRFMLAICGELTGLRLEQEILRISQTQLTKAAWIALVNNQKARAIRMLKQSDSDIHRLLSSFLQQGRIDPIVAKELQLSDPYMRAMVNYLAGGASWELTINDPDLPLLDRTVLAIRFVNDASLSVFLDNQLRIAQQQGSLQGIPLTGLGPAGLEVISRYVDVTGDIQVAAILGSTCRRPTAQVTRWIEDYRDLLDSWALYRARVMFDMSRGNISRWYGDEVKTLKQVIVRCNFCQKNITGTGNRAQTSQNKTRISGCPTCHNRLPRCVICLLQIDMVPPEGPSPNTLEAAFVFCQTCHHGGHYQHIVEWFYGTGEEAGPSPHAVCAVSGCDCNCAALR